MFSHSKRFQDTIGVSEPNAGFTQLLPDQLGGAQAQIACYTASATDGKPVTDAALRLTAAPINSGAARTPPSAKTKSAAPRTSAY